MKISLNGIWDVSYDSRDYTDKLSVPGIIPIKPSTYPEPVSLKVWYRKKFHLDREFKRAILKFYGVDNYCNVKINGKKVGEHKGGFDSFFFDITDFLKQGENEIVVYVEDKPLEDSKYEIVGKQHWYGNCVGIWQDVGLLLFENATYFKDVRFILSERSIEVSSEVEGEWDEIEYELFDGREKMLEGRSKSSEFSINPSKVKSWSFTEPKLYILVLKLLKDGKVVDALEKRVGFRDIESKDGKVYLNGKPVYLKGLLDQDFYPETGYVPPSKDYIVSQFEKIKQMGFNMVRYHVKIPPRIYMEAADEVGILVWIDLPYANRLNKSSREYLKKLAEDLKSRYSSSPSFVILTLINESWGINLSWTKEKDWLMNFWKQVKELFPDRLIVDNSPCCGNKHVSSDINDYHFYFSYPDNKKNWDKTIESFARGKFRTFYMRRKYSLKELFEMVEKKLKIPKSNFDLSKLPKIVSEFGCWGLPDPSLFVGDWFKYPIFDGKSVSDFIKEFEELYYRTPSEMAVDSQWKEFQTLKYEIESMRIHPEIAGYVLTELSDISWEANGVLDFDRNPKVFAPYLKWLNLDLLPIYRDGMIYISNMSSTDLRCRVIAKLDGEKILDEKLTVKSFNVWKRRLDFEGGGLLDLEILDEQGRTVGRNFYNLVRWKKVKFSVQKGIKANILKRVENGETILVQLNEEGEYLDGKVKVYSSKTPAFGFDSHWANWSGDWIGAFYYYHPSLMDLLSPYLGGMELSDLLGDKIIISEEGKILIGKYIGWNMAKCGYLVEIKFGKGRLLLTTLKLEDTELGKKIIERLKIQE